MRTEKETGFYDRNRNHLRNMYKTCVSLKINAFSLVLYVNQNKADIERNDERGED